MLTLFSESCPDSVTTEELAVLTSSFLTKTKLFGFIWEGKNEKCSRRGWDYLVERAKALETNRCGSSLSLFITTRHMALDTSLNLPEPQFLHL